MSSEAEKIDFEVVADKEGRILALARAAPRGRAAAHTADAIFGPTVSFEIPRGAGPVDIGTLILPGRRIAEWDLEFVDESGAPVPGATLRMGAGEWWEMEFRPGFDLDAGGLLAGPDGRIQIPMACREESVYLAVGTDLHRTRALALDCRAAGKHRGRVVLKERPFLRVRLYGPSAGALVAAGAVLRVHTAGSGLESGIPTVATDLRTGEEVPLPERAYLPPTELLENALRARSVRRVDATEFEARVQGIGDFNVTLTMGEDIVARSSVTLEEGNSPSTVALTIPQGRLVRLDDTEFRSWLTRDGTGTWLSRYAAWVSLPRTRTLPDGSSLSSMPVDSCWFPGFAEGRAKDSGTVLWIPPEARGVDFGFVEPASQCRHAVTWLSRSVVWGNLPEETATIAVPVPLTEAAGASLVRLHLRARGAPFAAASVPVTVLRLRETPLRPGSLLGRVDALTGAEGVATVRLFPGRYAAAVSTSVAPDTGFPDGWVVLEVGTPGEERDLDIPLSYAR